MVALDLAKKMIMVRVCIEFVFVSQVLKCAHFYRIIALYANLKPNAVMVPIWLFPIQLEYIHICEECTFCKANREIGNGVTYVVHSNTLYLYFKYTCALLKKVYPNTLCWCNVISAAKSTKCWECVFDVIPSNSDKDTFSSRSNAYNTEFGVYFCLRILSSH